MLLWLAVRDADLDAVRRALQAARIELVVLAVVVLAVGYGFQAARWRSVARAPGLGGRAFYGMLLGGLACNNVLPIRVGELMRARWLSRDAPMAGGRAFGSVVLDRMCDVVTLAAFLAVSVQVVAPSAWLLRLELGTLVALIAIAGALVVARAHMGRRRRKSVRRSRGTLARILLDTLDMLGEPIGRRRAATWLVLSACAWGLSALATALVARSVGIDLTPLQAVFVTSSLALGVAVPSSPGYIGTYQWLGVVSLGLLDVPVEQALASAILLQASWYIPTTLAGGAYVGARNLRARSRARMSPAVKTPA